VYVSAPPLDPSAQRPRTGLSKGSTTLSSDADKLGPTSVCGAEMALILLPCRPAVCKAFLEVITPVKGSRGGSSRRYLDFGCEAWIIIREPGAPG
jgi:hypothetical protein